MDEQEWRDAGVLIAGSPRFECRRRIAMNATTKTQFVGDASRLKSRVNILKRLRPEFYEKEVEKIFRRGWLPVASLTDVPETNSYAVVDVPTLKTSLILTRGEDDKIRAFHNICRHRGNRLVPPGKGCKRAFSCGFHGWAFANDGRLISVTDRTQFDDLDEGELGLLKVHAEAWEDFVFVNFDPAPRESLREWLGKMYDEYTGYFSDREKIASYRIQVESNWNVTINSFSEGYHSLYVHRKTVPDYQGGKDNPQRHRAYLELMKRNARYTAQGNPNRKETPVEAIAYGHGRKMYPAFPRYMPSDNTVPPGVNASRNENWSFDVLEMFPHVIVLIGAHWHANMWFWPVDAGRTDIRVDFLAYKAETVGDHFAHAYFRARLREVFREDIGTMEAIGAMLRSGAMSDIMLSRQELLIQQHYAAADEMIQQP
jgi:Rieske 2Fe-2S family protein